eukprot:gene12195-8393_t
MLAFLFFFTQSPFIVEKYRQMSHLTRYRSGDKKIIGIIGDEDTVTGFLLAGVGDNTNHKENGNESPNYYVITPSTPIAEVEFAFVSLTNRADIGIIIICQHVANSIRHLLQEHNAVIPSIIEIPSKGQKYDAEQDYVLQKYQGRWEHENNNNNRKTKNIQGLSRTLVSFGIRISL